MITPNFSLQYSFISAKLHVECEANENTPMLYEYKIAM